jgi:hypothetical protein
MSPEWVTAIANAVGAIATTVGAIATLLAVVAALGIAIWGDWLKSLTSRPKLTLSISMQPPDCHRIQVVERLPAKGPTVTSSTSLATILAGQPATRTFDTYFCRLAVGNGGKAAARNVGVRAIKLWRLDSTTGSFNEDPHFMPMDLTWSHTNDSLVTAKIDPELPKHCNLAQITELEPTLLQLSTEVVPYEVAPGVYPTKKPAGTYRLRIAATADNSKPLYRTLKIAFEGKWYKTEAEMFTKGVVVTVEEGA